MGVNRIGAAIVTIGMASFCAGAWGQGKTPSPALLVLSKEESFLAIVDPATLKVVGKVETGVHPHEVAASADGKIAIVTNYGNDHAGTTMSEIDLVSRSEVGKVTFPGLVGPHGIEILGDKAFFTVEGDKSVGVFDLWPTILTCTWCWGRSGRTCWC